MSERKERTEQLMMKQVLNGACTKEFSLNGKQKKMFWVRCIKRNASF